jgi:hypothetical protein
VVTMVTAFCNGAGLAPICIFVLPFSLLLPAVKLALCLTN